MLFSLLAFRDPAVAERHVSAYILALFLVATFPMPDNLTEVKKVGCSCEQITEFRDTTRWHTNVWVEYKNGKKWSKLYSIREGNERKKALIDCNTWMSEFYKRAKKERK